MSDLASLRESLRRGAVRRAAIKARFGFVPVSTLHIPRGALGRRLFVFQGERPGRHAGNANPRNRQQRARIASKLLGRRVGAVTGRQIGRGTPGTSIMPAEAVEFFIRYYAEPGHVYLDPFMGQGIQMQVAKLMGLDYYGYDLCEEFCEYIESVRERIDDGKTVLQTFHGDSRYPDAIPDGIGNFGFASPPYWDIEDYGTDPGQLGTGKGYDDFLEGMHAVAKAWLPKFKPGAWYVVNVNDFRKDGRFYPYHAHTIDVHCRAGWRLVDTWILTGLSGLARAFAVGFNEKRIAPKVHEYALVFRKPD